MSEFLQGKLDNQEIHKKLTEYKFPSGFDPSEALIGSIIEQFWFHDFYNSFLSDPVYLNYLIQYLDKNHLNKFNRYDFYSFIFDEIIKDEISRKVLQLIALNFEKLQINEVVPNNYDKFLKKCKVSLGLFDTAWMKKNHLGKITDKEGNKMFVWEHHSFTEFLVAEYLLTKPNFIDEFQKFSILKQEGITAFKPSWSGVLRFLMESQKGPKVMEWVLRFLEDNKDNIDDNLSEILVFESKNLSDQINKKIFNLIYNSYFERIVWLPIWTRRRLSKFVDIEIYKRLKHDIKKWPDQTETFVKRGNVVTIIEGLLEAKNKIINSKEKIFWHKTLINFANDPEDGGNGVLQRDSLSALASYKDEKIIPKVAEKCFETTQDTLVKDEFIQLCYNSAPNSKYSIDYFIKGIKSSTGIYARHGLYKITDKDSIKYFLTSVSEDDQFLRSFLSRESIFDKEDGDEQLVNSIKNIIDKNVIKLLKKIVFRVFNIANLYQEEKSNFIKQIVLMINKNDLNFLFEILDEIKKQSDHTKSLHLFFDYEEVLAILLSPENVKHYYDKAKSISDKHVDLAIYTAKRINGGIGQSVYRKAVSLKLVKSVDEKAVNLYWESQEKNRKQKRLDEFLRLLEPGPGKFFPGVFEYYLQNRKEFDEYFKAKEGIKAKNRITKLAVDEGINKIDPRKFKVKIENKEESNHRFTWSAPASYFGDILSVVRIFAPDELKKHKQQIIDFIPYAFSDDMSQIMELIPDINDKDFEFVNKVMSDQTDDRRYLVPGTYIHLVGYYAKKGRRLIKAKRILKSFVYDKYIPDYEQRSALENLSHFIDKNDPKMKLFLKNIFKKRKTDDRHRHLAQIANALLISIYRDRIAIDWRLKQLKTPLSFEGKYIVGEVHEVGLIEDELDTMAFAKPLIDLEDEKYLPKFLNLIDYSFKILKKNKDKKYLNYVNYLWRITTTFVDSLKEKGSFKPLQILENQVTKYSKYANFNWLKVKIKELRTNYINSIGRFIFTKEL